jgi:hypothetical protein
MSWGDVAFDADLVANVLGDFPIVWYETLGPAKCKQNDRVWEVRAHLGRDPITAISGNWAGRRDDLRAGTGAGGSESRPLPG